MIKARYTIVAFALASAGCSISSSANAKHTGGPPACSDDSSAVAIDVLLAAAATGVLYLTGDLDDSPAWLAVPGVFVASGTAGVFMTRSCARRQRAAARNAGVPERGRRSRRHRLPSSCRGRTRSRPTCPRGARAASSRSSNASPANRVRWRSGSLNRA